MLHVLESENLLDLHGQASVRTARAAVLAFLKQALENQLTQVTIITGIGNHPNQSQKRGVFFKTLPQWLNDAPFRPQIKYLLKQVGSYEVALNPSMKNIGIPFIQHTQSYKTDPLRQLCASDRSINPLFTAIQQSDPIHRLSVLKALLEETPERLHQTADNEITVLMVAAAYNQVDTMMVLISEERRLGLIPKLLKQRTLDGTHALMFAVMHDSLDAIDLLLEQAPSLLKQKRLDGLSIFMLATQSANPSKMLQHLYSHLEPHRREPGYSGLFHEYKRLTENFSFNHKTLPNNSAIPIIQSSSFKAHRLKFRWFFIDRMRLFLKKLNRKKSKSPFFKKSLQKALNQGICTPTQTRKIWSLFLKRNQKLKNIFLRFNDAQKPRFKKQWKGFIVHPPLSKKQQRIPPKTPKTLTLFLEVENGPPRVYHPARTPALILRPDKKIDILIKNHRTPITSGSFQKTLLDFFYLHQKKQRISLPTNSKIIQLMTLGLHTTQSQVKDCVSNQPTPQGQRALIPLHHSVSQAASLHQVAPLIFSTKKTTMDLSRQTGTTTKPDQKPKKAKKKQSLTQ